MNLNTHDTTFRFSFSRLILSFASPCSPLFFLVISGKRSLFFDTWILGIYPFHHRLPTYLRISSCQSPSPIDCLRNTSSSSDITYSLSYHAALSSSSSFSPRNFYISQSKPSTFQACPCCQHTSRQPPRTFSNIVKDKAIRPFTLDLGW